MKKLVLIFAAILLTGCARVPFKSVKYSRIQETPQAMLENFQQRLPAAFEITESVVFNYRGRKMTALGYTLVDSEQDSVGLSGVTPVGMKLFDVRKSRGKLEYSFSLPAEIDKKVDKQKVAYGMLEDVERIYLGRLPSNGALAHPARDRVYVTEQTNGSRLEYVFGGPYRALVEKRGMEDGKEIWRVRYFDYQEKNGRLYPNKIYYQNHKGHYSLTLRLKEIKL